MELFKDKDRNGSGQAATFVRAIESQNDNTRVIGFAEGESVDYICKRLGFKPIKGLPTMDGNIQGFSPSNVIGRDGKRELIKIYQSGEILVVRG